MSFPFLDSLGLPGREATRRQASHFTDTLVAGVSRAAASIEKTLASPSDVGPRLVSAWKSGELTEKQFRDNVTISFVAGQENPQLGLISIMYLLAKHPVSESLLLQTWRCSCRTLGLTIRAGASHRIGRPGKPLRGDGLGG